VSTGAYESISGGAEREERNLRRAVEANGDADGAEAAIHVELQAPKTKPTLDILAAQRRKGQRADEWQPDLAAVGVTREYERERPARWTRQKIVDVVGCVAKEHDGFMRQIADGFGNRQLGVGYALERIVKPGKPESCARAFDGRVRVIENGNAIRSQRRGDVFPSNYNVVVAEHGITVEALDLVEEIGALPRRAEGGSLRQNPVGHIVAGQKNRVGVQAVDVAHSVAEEEWLSVFVHMDVAELRDAESVECLSKAGNEHVAVRDLDPVPLDLAPIDRQTANNERSANQEAAPRHVQFGGVIRQYSILSRQF